MVRKKEKTTTRKFRMIRIIIFLLHQHIISSYSNSKLYLDCIGGALKTIISRVKKKLRQKQAHKNQLYILGSREASINSDSFKHASKT